MKQDNVQSTKKTLNSFFKLLSDNQNIRAVLNSNKNQIANYLFSVLGYKFEGSIHNANFYHYTSEAWLLAMYQELKEDLQKEILNKLKNNEQAINIEYDYNNIIEKISNLNVDETNFLRNLELLLGTYKTSDNIVKITQVKLSQLFLKKVSIAKKEILSKKIPSHLSKKEFEDLLICIMRRGLNYTLNELDPKEEDKYSLLINDAYTHLQTDSEVIPSFDAYLQEINKRKSVNEETPGRDRTNNEDVELPNAYSIFYNFAVNSFKDFNQDIKLFNLNSSSTLFKIKKLTKNYLSNLSEFAKLSSNLVDYLSNNLKALRTTKAVQFLHSVYSAYRDSFKNGLDTLNNKYTDLRGWINKSYADILHTDFIQKISNTGTNARIYIYENIVSPARDVFVFYSTNTFNIVVKTANWTKEQITNVIKSVSEIICSVASKASEGKKSYFGEGPLFNIHTDQEKYINIEINKSLNILDNEKVKDAANEIVNKIVNMSMYEAIETGVKNTIAAKKFIVERFRKMLSCGEDKREESGNSNESDKSNKKGKCTK